MGICVAEVQGRTNKPTMSSRRLLKSPVRKFILAICEAVECVDGFYIFRHGADGSAWRRGRQDM